MSGLRGIDHVLLAVRDLDQAHAAFTRLGFRLTPRGTHVGWGTANHCIMFPSDYLELIAVVDPAQPTQGIETVLEAKGEGGFGLALSTVDPRATAKGWAEAGLEPDGPKRLARRLEDGAELAFENVMLDPARTDGLRLFACRALEPESLRRRAWLAHPNGAIGLGSVTVVAREPERLAGSLARIFGEGALTATDATVTVHTGHGQIVVATPEDIEMLHPTFGEVQARDTPAVHAVTLLVENPEASASMFAEAGVAFERDPVGTVVIGPSDACGLWLELAGTDQIRLRPSQPR